MGTRTSRSSAALLAAFFSGIHAEGTAKQTSNSAKAAHWTIPPATYIQIVVAVGQASASR